MTKLPAGAAEARRLLQSCYDGVLSTHSVALPGYPFGSVVPYCLDRAGEPVILIADIAQHRKNILQDPKVSLIVFDRSASDLQANGRLTMLADASRIDAADADTVARFERYFPESAGYHLTHNFEFWRLRPRKIRFIGGFGAIHWLEPAAVCTRNPFDSDTETAMVAHMNADHPDALRCYLVPLIGETAALVSAPTMAGVDSDGIDLRTPQRLHRIWFPAPVDNTAEVRAALVRLAQST